MPGAASQLVPLPTCTLLAERAEQPSALGCVTHAPSLPPRYSSDALTVRKTLVRLSALVSAPLIIVGSMILLLRQIGAAAIVGFVVLLIMTPGQIKLGKYLRRLTKRTMKFSDKRLKYINEVVQGACPLSFVSLFVLQL